MKTNLDLSKIPAVDSLLQTQEAAELIAEYGRSQTLEAIRFALDELRDLTKGRVTSIPTPDEILRRVRQVVREWTLSTLRPVVNATGVILHTNLGRAPLSEAAMQAVQGVALGYSTLEYDLDEGKRGSRYVHAEDLLVRLTGAEAALVVNNNASAVMLALAGLSRRRRTLISRTQLVEIGGGFRIPDVMKQSGAILEEIGTTNRVHMEDYRKALAELPIKLVMRAHRSNFRLVGFTAEPELSVVVALAHAAGVPVFDDLGSGTLIDTARFGLEHEPTIQESLKAGVDLVSFSGDKLLGGPQAGIIVGSEELVDKLRNHPLARAVRADKLALAGLSATLMHYVKEEAEREIPVWQMMSMKAETLRGRARRWAGALEQGEVIPGESTVGGGSLPGGTLPTYLLALDVPNPDRFLALLRRQQPPIIARVQDDRVVFDPRTVFARQEGGLLVGLQNVLAKYNPPF